MASVGEGDCHKDPNFAVVCSFLDKYGASLGLEPISYSDLQKYLEDTTSDVSRVLIDIHVRLLRRIGKSIVNSERFEKSVIKFCHHFSEFDAWEVESYGYKHAQLATKLRILKNLLECQFDYNLKFKEKINGQSAEEMRFIPIGRDKEGQAYWYFLDHDMNLLVYKEEQDDDDADTWKLVCRNRRELASLVSSLQNVKEQQEDKTSTCDSRSSKEGSPDKDVNAEHADVKDNKLTQSQTLNVKKEETAQEKSLDFKKDKKIVHEQVEVAIDNKVTQEQAENVKKEKLDKGQIGMKEMTTRRQLVVVLKRGKTVQEQEVDVKEEKVVQELVDVKKEKPYQEQDMDVEKEGKTGQHTGVGKAGKEDQAMDVGKEVEMGKEQDINVGKEGKRDQEMKNVVKEGKMGKEQKMNVRKKGKLDKEQDMDVVKDGKTDQEQKYVLKKGKRSKEQKMDFGKEGKRSKEQEKIVGKEGKSGQEQEMDVGKDGKTGQEQEMDVGKDGKTGQEQEMDVGKDGKTGQEQEMDVGKDGKTGQEQEMDVGKAEKRSKEQEMDSGKEGETIQEQELILVKEGKTDLNRVEDVVKKKINSRNTYSNKPTLSPLPCVDVATPVSGSDREKSSDDHNSSGCENLASKDKEMVAANCSTDSVQQFSHCADREPPSGNKLTDLGKMVSDENEDEDETEGDISVDNEKAAKIQCGNLCASEAIDYKVVTPLLDETSVMDIPLKTSSGESHEVESHLLEAQAKFPGDAIVKQSGATKVASVVDLKQADETITEVEVKQQEQMKVPSEVKFNQGGETKVAVDVELNQDKEKSASIVEVNQEKVISNIKVSQKEETEIKAKVEITKVGTKVLDLDVNCKETKVTSDIEVNRKETKVAEINFTQKDAKTVDVEICQGGEAKVISSIEVNRDKGNETEADVNQENTKVASEIKEMQIDKAEVTRNDETKVTVETLLNQEDTKIADVEVRGDKSTEIKGNQAGEKEVTLDDEINQEERKVSLDVEVNQEGTKVTIESNTKSHCEDLSKDTLCSDEAAVAPADVLKAKDSQIALTSADLPAHSISSDVVAGSSDVSSIVTTVDSLEHSSKKQDKSQDVNNSKASLKFSSEQTHSDGCHDSDTNAHKSIICEQAETTSECSDNASNNYTKDSFLKVENLEKAKNTLSKMPGDNVSTQSADKSKDVDNIQSSSGTGDKHECLEQTKQQDEPGKESLPLISLESNTKEKESAQLTHEKGILRESKADNHPEKKSSPGNEENVESSESASLNKTSGSKESVGKDDEKSGQLMNGRSKKKDPCPVINTDMPEAVTPKVPVHCDDDKTECVESNNKGDSITEQNGIPAEEMEAAGNETPKNSKKLATNATSKSQSQSRRQLKRAVPEPASDDPVDSEPNGKRARQATKTQKTRSGRNAAVRVRAARLASKDTESEDSEVPLSQIRDRGQGLVRESSCRLTRGRANQINQAHKSKQEPAIDDDAEEGISGKRGKKKKPDSSSEALSEEEATPAKKGRNQAQASNACKTKNFNKGKGRNVVIKKPIAKPASAPAAEDEAGGVRRSVRVRQLRARRPPTPSSPSEETEETSEDEDSSEEDEEDHDKNFLDASFTPEEEESGDEDFRPKGRNFQRQAARTSQEETEEVVNDDTPCVKCGKYNHPEMILLCDKCDAGYHTACLRPPLMLIPDGDWFCPPCEHSRLVEKLLECLQSFDVSMKKKDRLSKRQERLAFVGISISNILHGGRKFTPHAKSEIQGRYVSNRQDHLDRDTKAGVDESVKQEESANSSSNESEPEPKHTYRSERLALRQAQKRSCRDKHRSNRRRRKRSPEVEVLSQRTCRTRAAVSYQFKEFDELISNAIEDDKPYRREKPPGINRGKDMSNILGASDEEDEKIRQRDGDNSQPPPVVRKKTKRRLTRLDSDEEPDEDDSDEFQISENDDSDATEGEGEEDAENEVGSSDSGDWRPQRTWYNSHTSSRRSNRKIQNFVVDDDDYNSDENASKRRSTRNSNRGRIHYSDWDSNEETEAEASEGSSDYSLYAGKKSQKQRPSHGKRKVTPGKKKAKNFDNSDSDSSITIKRKNLRKIIKKRRKDASESEDSQKEAEKEVNEDKQVKMDSEESDFVLDEESQEDSDDSPKFKKKNVLRSSDEDGEEEQVKDDAGLKPMVEATETIENADSTNQVEAVPEVEAAPEVEGLPQQVEDLPPQVEALPIPDAVVESQQAAVSKNKPKPTAKGKKRNDRHAEDKVTVPVADVAVPGKVRKVSSSDREPDALTEMRSQLPVPGVGAPTEEKNKQESKINSIDTQEPEIFPQDQKSSPIAGGKGCDTSHPTDKISSGGKKKTVPNFLDVNSGEESDEQRQDQHKEAAVPSYIADITNVQTTMPSQSSSDSGQARVVHLENHPQHRNFPHPSQHYPFNVRSYNNSVPGAPPYPQHQVMGSPQNLGQTRHDSGQPSHNSNITNPAAHNGPPGLIQAFPDPMTQHPNTGQGNTVAQGVRGPPPFIGRGPRPSSGHPYPPGLGHSSPQSMEHGQNAPNVNQEHHMSHSGFQGIPVSRHAPPGPTVGHVRSGMVQQHCGGMRPFYMGQQQHAHPNMESDSGANMGGYIPQNYGSRRMPSAQEMGPGGIRNPYYGMQSSPPHSMGHHLVRQYPGNMGSGPHMSSPLTSMGQMARNLGSGANMHSPPNTQPMGGCEERRSSLGSPPNQESAHRQEKVEMREVKTECDMDDSPDKRVGKVGKKRTTSSKSKKKSSESNEQCAGLSQHLKQGPHTASEIKERVPEPGQIIGGYRGTGQPYHMPPYPMPYSHGSMPNINPQPGTQGSYMNPRHTPPALAQQGSNADGNKTHSKDVEGKWNRADSTEAQPTSMPNVSPVEQRLKMSPYQQNLQKSQPKGQTVPSLERRHSQSPVHQNSDASAANHSQEQPSAKPINMRTQEAGMEPNPHTQVLPPVTHSSDISPNSQDGNNRSMVSGQTIAPNTHDHSMRAGAHRHNLPPYSQGSGVGTAEPPGPYYSAGPYPSPYGPNPNQPMSQNSGWGPDIQGYGPRYGPHVYPYVRNPTNPGNRMPSGKPLYGSHGPPGSDVADAHVKGPAASQEPCIKEEPGKKPKGVEQQGPTINRHQSSSEYQMSKNTEPGHTYPNNMEQDIKPFRRHSDAGMEGENLSTSGIQRSQPLSEPVASLSSSMTTTSPSASIHTASHLSDGMTTVSVSKQSSSTDQSSFQHSTSSNVNQSHQVPPVTSMAPHSTWSRPSTTVPYAHQHMGQWPNMGRPGHYGMARPYAGPGGATRSPYGMDPQAGPMRPNPSHGDQKFMYQAYDLRFQSSNPGGPGGSESEYHRSGYNQDYPSPGRFPQQYQSCHRSQEGSSHQASHPGIDQVTEGSTVSKPKRAKTQKKTGKDGSGPVRGKSGRGRGRGRGGFMIDNLLQAQGVEVDDEQGEDSAEINDIVSYVTTDEYFKQQTGSGNFPRQTEVGLGGEKK